MVSALRVPIVRWLSILIITLLLAPVSTQPGTAQPVAGTLVYHQITDFPEGNASVGYPVLSADGTTGVFVDAPGTGDAATPNRIFVIGADGGGQTEVDAYQTRCFCGSTVDISADGGTVISTDSVQLRIAGATGAEGRNLVTLSSNEITAAMIAGNGETVFFLVRRDAATEAGEAIPRGVWAIDADGSNLRQVVGADAIAAEIDVPVEQTGCCLHADGRPLDVSDGGDRLVFGAYAGDGEHVFAVDADGGSLHRVRESVQNVVRVAISGDGDTIAYDVIPLGASANELATVAFAGGEPRIYPVAASGIWYDEPLQLSADGSQLLVSPVALLIDTATGDTRLLATSITGVGGNHEAVLTDGLARATMDADAGRFLYAMRTARCADCANLAEQLATLEIAPADPGAAPSISATLEPGTIMLDRGSQASVEATIEAADPVLGVGFAALLDGGVVDANVGQGRVLLDDGQNGDATARNGVYTATAIEHAPVVLRDPDTGPRTVRIAAETEDGDGLRHATAVDIGVLTVSGP